MQKEDKLSFACSVTPADEAAFVRLYVDDKLVGWQRGNLGKIEWVAEKFEPGEHQVRVEATWSNGLMSTSPNLKFILND